MAWLGLTALLCPSVASAQIPIPMVRTGIVRDKVKAERQRIDALKAQAATISELKKWASTNKFDLQRVYKNSEENFRQARQAILRAKGQTQQRWVRPQGFEVETARLAPSRIYPTTSSYKVQTVNPDDFYVHVQSHYPNSWVNTNKRVRINWYIFDERYLPMASPQQNNEKAIYTNTYNSKAIRFRSMRYSNHVAGLGLKPGRYFVAAVFREKRAYVPYSQRKRRRYVPAQTQVSLAVFRVTQSPSKEVKVVLPHYRTWYSTYKNVIRLEGVNARYRRGKVEISGKFDHTKFVKGGLPTYLEVTAKTGKLRRAIYRQAVKVRSVSGNRFRITIKDHGLPVGTQQLDLSVYGEYATGRKYYRPQEGARADQILSVMVQ